MSDSLTYNDLIQQVSSLLQSPGSSSGFLSELLGVLQAHVGEADLDFHSSLRKLHEVYVQLNQLESLDDLYLSLVALGTHELGFDRLHLLLLDNGRFKTLYSGTQQGHIQKMAADYEPSPECQRLLLDLMHSGQDAQIWPQVDLVEDMQVVGQGWQMIALMNDDDQTIGALSVDNLYGQQPPRSFEQVLLVLYSGALGNMIARKRTTQQWHIAQQHAEAFQNYLKRLNEVSIDLSAMRYGSELYRQVIVQAKERLGFDRMGLFVFDPATDALSGCFGTDSEGQVRDERHLEVTMGAKQDFLERVSQHTDRVIVKEECELWDKDQMVGRGWHATAAIWDGSDVMGYLVIDNLTSQAPLRPYETELISLYSTTIGHLISRKRQEKALRDSEARFRMLLEIAPVGVIVVTENGKVVSANKYALMMFGYSRKEADELWLQDLLPDDVRHDHRQYANSFFDNPGDQPIYMAPHMEPLGKRRDGQLFPIQVALSAFQIEGEHLALAAIADLTQQKEAEQQRFALQLEQERTHILTEFIRDAAHEFRTPLSIVKSSTYLLERIEDPARRDEIYGRIRGESDHIVSLVDALSTLARLDRNSDIELRRCNLAGVIHGVVDSMSGIFADHQLKPTLDLTDSPVMINGSAEDLNLALQCLLDNAIRYSAPEGEILIELRSTASHAVIRLRDQGMGIPEDILQNIFTRFYRADYAHSTRGFGLGLPIVQKVIEIHDGTLDLASVVGEGSTFTISLPLAGD